MKFPWFHSQEELGARQYQERKVPDRDWYIISPLIEKREWTPDPIDPYGPLSELSWRSTILNSEGEEISGGLPKFQDFGLCGIVDEVISSSIASGKSLITKKEDGSLIIRSVYLGEVIFRTRGSYALLDFEPHVMPLIKRYDCLLDPKFHPDLDLYFEFVSPNNLIVIKHDYEDLIFLHAKDRETHRMLSWEELERVASGCLRLVELVTGLTDNSPSGLKRTIDALEESGEWKEEGVVVRDTVTGWMCRIKGEEYKRLHRIRFFFTFNRLVEVCTDKNVSCHFEMTQALKDLDIDVDMLPHLDEWFAEYMTRRNRYLDKIAGAIQWFAGWQEQNPDDGVDDRERRKQFAKKVNSERKDDAFYLFALMNGGNGVRETEQKMWKKIVIDPPSPHTIGLRWSHDEEIRSECF